MRRIEVSALHALLFGVGVLALLSSIRLGLADTIYLQNGERVEGRVTRETPAEVTVDFGFGQTTLERKKIIKIEKGPFPPVTSDKDAAAKTPAPAQPPPAAQTAPKNPPRVTQPVAKPTGPKEGPTAEGPASPGASSRAQKPVQSAGKTQKK